MAHAVTALDRAEAQALLRSAGIEGDFRGLLTEREAGCAVCSRTMLEKAMRRLRSQKADTVVFTGTLALVETAKKAGFRAVAVGGGAVGKTSGGRCALSLTTSCRTTRTGSGWNKTAYEKRRTAASSFYPYSFFSLVLQERIDHARVKSCSVFFRKRSARSFAMTFRYHQLHLQKRAVLLVAEGRETV